MRQKTHILCCALVVALSMIHIRFAWAADAPVTDFDKRAAATLFTGYDGKPVSWEQIKADSIKTLTRVEKAADGKLTYVMNFGGVQGGVDNRGYLRITKGEELPDAAKGGWTPHKVDAATGAEVFYKKVESNAGNYINLAVRRKMGQVILTIAQRRPFTEALDAGAKDVCKRFGQFLDAGRKNGLFGGEVKMWLTSLDSQPQLTAGEPLAITLLDDGERELPIRMKVFDTEGNAIANVKELRITLGGAFAPFAKVKYQGKAVEQSKGKYVIRDPQQPCEVVVTLPPSDRPEIQDALYAGLDGSRPADASGLAINVDAELK